MPENCSTLFLDIGRDPESKQVIENRSIVMDGGLEGLEKFTRQTAKRSSFWPRGIIMTFLLTRCECRPFCAGIVIAALYVSTLVCLAGARIRVSSHREQPNPAVGDSPETVPPLAHLSPKLRRRAIAKAMRKVGDWELNRHPGNFDQDWTFAALYAGFMAASRNAALCALRNSDARRRQQIRLEARAAPGPRRRSSHRPDLFGALSAAVATQK